MRSKKRKYTRFLVQDNVYAALGTHFSRVGKLKNISIDGLAFDYIENKQAAEPDCSVVSIFHSENNFFLSNLECIVIYDYPKCIKLKESSLKQKFLVKRCAVQFMAINTLQKKKLEFFFDNFTCGILPFSKETSPLL